MVLADRLETLSRVRARWEELLERCEDPQVTLSPEWLLTWWRVFGGDGGRRLRSALFYDSDRLVGLAPLLYRTCWHRPGIPFRRLELIGSGEREADEIASEYLGVLSKRGREQEIAFALVDALVSGRLGGWDELVLPRMSGDASMTGALSGALEASGLRVEVAHASSSFYAPLPASWDDYLASLSSSRRYRLRRTLRDFKDWAGGSYRLERAQTHAELLRGLAILEELHGERWRAAGRHGMFASARFRRFHQRVMPALHRRGALDILWLEARGEPIAALYNLICRGRVQFYQSGRRVDLPSHVKVGVVVHALAIDRAIAESRTEYDFLAGRARYKQELGPAHRRLVTLRALPRRSAREDARQLIRGCVLPARRAVSRRAAALTLRRQGAG